MEGSEGTEQRAYDLVLWAKGAAEECINVFGSELSLRFNDLGTPAVSARLAYSLLISTSLQGRRPSVRSGGEGGGGGETRKSSSRCKAQ